MEWHIYCNYIVILLSGIMIGASVRGMVYERRAKRKAGKNPHNHPTRSL